ncbi:uncharacterized protein LOC121734579 [Aricia agestis]|uniref:uncharacterized protein LOC121734579 n=1 Tax=Aricia agestis TaxID=91739 RepID=UPI001C20629B|nr:uncharacterized protein LOC121734579 [Aricia agestis]
MGEQVEDQGNETNLDNSGLTTFDNLTILKEFSNIVNLVKNEDFLETVPKSKLKRVKWVPMFNCLKQGILDEMVQEISSMWDFENMSAKLEVLEKQKEKFSEINPDQPVWRPQLNDVQGQLKASDVANLRKQKNLLESLAKEYESRANRLKKNITAKRGYLKAMQMDIQKYHKKNEDLVNKLNDKITNHGELVEIIIPNTTNIDDIVWSEKEINK